MFFRSIKEMNRLLKEINSLLSKRGQETESAIHAVHDLFQNDEIEAVFLILVTRNGKIVWKCGPNWPFYALTLRTKLY